MRICVPNQKCVSSSSPKLYNMEEQIFFLTAA